MTDIKARIAEPVNHMEYLLGETYREMLANIERWGHQHHPMTYDGAVPIYELREALYKDRWEMQNRDGEVTWDTIFLEEVYESLAERVPAKQVKELVQVAAVALAMAVDLMTQEGEGDD